MMYLEDGDRMAVFASKAGAPTNPTGIATSWRIRGDVEVGTETFDVDAETAGPRSGTVSTRSRRSDMPVLQTMSGRPQG